MVVLKYSDPSQIFSDWRNGAVRGEACCALNYLADSNEQVFILLSVPDTNFSCLWTGSFLRVKYV